MELFCENFAGWVFGSKTVVDNLRQKLPKTLKNEGFWQIRANLKANREDTNRLTIHVWVPGITFRP
jgi:hypothetical protein